MEDAQAHKAELMAEDQALMSLPTLSEIEQQADSKLALLKQQFHSQFSSDQMIEFYGMLEPAKETGLYDWMRRMPKGTLHHLHEVAGHDFVKTMNFAKDIEGFKINP
jgi:hypothetical protein